MSFPAAVNASKSTSPSCSLPQWEGREASYGLSGPDNSGDRYKVRLVRARLGCRVTEQLDDGRMAGEDQHLVGARKLREGNGGAKRAVGIEVDENLVNDYRERLRTLSQFADQAEPQG